MASGAGRQGHGRFRLSDWPFATADLSGLDTGYDSRQRRAAQNPNYRKLSIADAIVEAGRLGQKTGAGWFRYEKGDRTPTPRWRVSSKVRVPQRTFSDEEILRRLMFASVNALSPLTAPLPVWLRAAGRGFR
jgi:3-hydroxyacyl-CoA dehydrogenase